MKHPACLSRNPVGAVASTGFLFLSGLTTAPQCPSRFDQLLFAIALVVVFVVSFLQCRPLF